MKKLLVLALLFIGIKSFSQGNIPLGSPNRTVEVLGSLRVDTLFYLPQRTDTLFTPGRAGAFVFAYGGGWLYSGTQWTRVTGIAWGNIPGTLSAQSDLNTALNGKQALLSNGYGWKLIGATGVFDSANVRKVDSVFRVNDSTIGYPINGVVRTIVIKGTAGGSIVSGISLIVPTGVFTSPVTFVNTGGSWSGTLAYINQGANSVFAGPTIGSPGQPAFRALVPADMPTGIPSGNLSSSTIGFTTGTTGTDINWSAVSATLGGGIQLNSPNSSSTTRGPLTSSDWIRFVNKIDSLTLVGGDSIYYWSNGGRTFAFITATGAGNTNSNVGSFYRLAIPGTNNIKTVAPNALAWVKMDSTSNANTITVFADSATIAGYLLRRADSSYAYMTPTQVNTLLAGYITTALAPGLTIIGNGGGIAAKVAVTGLFSYNSTGVATAIDNAIANAKLAQMAPGTIKSQLGGSLANAADNTIAAVEGAFNPFSTSLQGLVPAPGSVAGKVLSDNGTWVAQTGGGTGCLNCNADSLKHLPIDTSVNRNNAIFLYDSVNRKFKLITPATLAALFPQTTIYTGRDLSAIGSGANTKVVFGIPAGGNPADSSVYFNHSNLFKFEGDSLKALVGHGFRINFTADAGWDIFTRDSATGFWTRIGKGAPGQSLQMLPGGGIGWAAQAGGGVSVANPSGLIGMSAVNGSSPNALRADGSSAIDPSIAPNWTGQHTHALSPIITPLAKGSRVMIDPVTNALATQPEVLHQPDTVATTAALPANTYNNGVAGVGATLTGNANGALPAQDGITLVAGVRMLVKNEAAPANNGNYLLTQVGSGGTPYILTRAPYSSIPGNMGAMTEFGIKVGTVNAGTKWYQQTQGTIVFGTTALVYAREPLSPTGITPGSYTNVNATFGVDGRATSVSNGTGGGGSSTNPVLGVLYAKNNFTSVSPDFTVNNLLSLSTSGGQLVMTGGSASNYINNATLTSYGKSLLEQNRMFMRFKVDSAKATTAAGPYLAYVSTALNSPLSLFAYCDLSLGGTGRIYLYDKLDGTLEDSSLTSLIYSTGDVLEYSLERTQGNTYVVTARDSTTNSPTLSFTFVNNCFFTNTTQAVSNTGYYGFGNRGGLYNIDSFSVTSSVVKNPVWMWVGDSKTFGYGAPFPTRVANLVGQYIPSLVVSAGPGDKTSDALSKLPEILSIAPQNVMLSVVSNDPDSNTTKTNYIALYDSLVAHSINVYHVWYYQANQIWFYNWLFATFPASTVIPLTALQNAGALNADNVHPTSLGDTLAFNKIMGSGKISSLNSKVVATKDATETERGFESITDHKILDSLTGYGDIIQTFLQQTATGPVSIQDRFIRANTTDINGSIPAPVSSGAWVRIGSPTAGIEQDSLYGSVIGNVQYHVPTTCINCAVSVIMANAATPPGGVSNLITAYTNTNTFMQITTSNGTAGVIGGVVELIGGIPTTLFAGSGAIHTGDTIRSVTLNGTVYVYQNSTLLYSGAYNTVALSGNGAGVGFFNDTSTKMQNFLVTDATNAVNFAWGAYSDGTTITGNGTKASPFAAAAGTGGPAGPTNSVQTNNTGANLGYSEFTHNHSTLTTSLAYLSSAPATGTADMYDLTPLAGSTVGLNFKGTNTVTGAFIPLETSGSYNGGVVLAISNSSSTTGAFSAFQLISQGGGSSASSSPFMNFRNNAQSTLKDYNIGNNAATGNFDFTINTAAFLGSGQIMSLTRAKNWLLGTTTDVPSSIGTIASTTQGVLWPRMTLAQATAISSPATSLHFILTDSSGKLGLWNGSKIVTYATTDQLGGSAASPKAFAATADASVNNTTTPTSLVGTGTGSQTIAANAFVAGSVLRFSGSGTITSAATAPGLSIALKIGTVNNTITPTLAGSVNGNIEWDVTGIVRTTGGTGSMSETGWISINGVKTYFSTGSPIFLNTTGTNLIDMVSTFSGTVGAGDVITITNSSIFLQ